MRLYPFFLKLENRPCAVVGGDSLAAQKARELIACGARVAVIDARPCPTMEEMAAAGAIDLQRRPYREGDLEGASIAVASTDDPSTLEAIVADADRFRVFLNVVDKPALCDFYAAALVRRGDLQIAISTNGKSPALAGEVRRELEERFGPEYGEALNVLGAVRRELGERRVPAEERQRVYAALARADLVQLFRQGRRDEVDAAVRAAVGGDIALGDHEGDLD